MSDPENPPAFPNGMTLRDWFAGQALAGIMANVELIKAIRDQATADGHSFERGISVTAKVIANAMLAERKL